MTIFDLIGLTGVAVILVTYFFLQTGKLKAEQTIYSALNFTGALLIFLSLVVDWNIAAVTIEVAWMVISLFGIFKSLKGRRSS